ncbi:hypothetical protein [Pararobbsia alpina]|uniref:hypothetical protein n=1 Tax=Pararobbsia alpina TaxID=621374 RepID=UPI0039A74387
MTDPCFAAVPNGQTLKWLVEETGVPDPATCVEQSATRFSANNDRGAACELA